MIMAFEPFSMVDYPGHIVATVFFGGCNFRCGYCHNPLLVNIKEKSQTSPSNSYRLYEMADYSDGIESYRIAEAPGTSYGAEDLDSNAASGLDEHIKVTTANLEISNSIPNVIEITETPEVTGFIEFLKTRKGLLDGVCLTGGEPLLSGELSLLARKIKELGFKVKLDTNGSNLEKLQEAAPYLDYIAMDIKSAPDKYAELTCHKNSWEKVSRTIEWIKNSRIAYEFRTTVMPVWHTFEDLKKIRDYLGEDTNWVLQQFRQPPDGVLDEKKYEAYPDSWLKEIGIKLNCQVRGLY